MRQSEEIDTVRGAGLIQKLCLGLCEQTRFD